MNIPFIKIIKQAQSKTDAAAKVAEVFCLLSDIKLSKTEIKVLAYFMVYGLTDKAKDLILKAKLLAKGSLKNTMSRLRTRKLILQDKDDIDYIREELQVSESPIVSMLIKIDNE